MDCVFDSLGPGTDLQPDVLVIFSTVALKGPAKKRKTSGASSSADGDSSTSKSTVPRGQLIDQLVAGGRGFSLDASSHVLKQGSQYFETRLARWHEGQEDALTTDGGKAVLVVPVEEHELRGCAELLRLMFLNRLAPAAAADPSLVRKVLMLADRFAAQACLDACADVLSAFGPEQITEQLLREVLQLPDPMIQQQKLAKLRTTCVQRLLQLFGDATAVAGSDEQRQRFCALPFEAVLAWADSDDLKSDSEDTVMLLLNAWVHAQKREPRPKARKRGQDAQQQEQLSQCIRVMHLSTWLLGVLQAGEIPWFRAEDAQRQLLTVMVAKVTDAQHAGQRLLSKRLAGLPAEWLRQARPRPDGLGPLAACKLSSTPEEVAAALAKSVASKSGTMGPRGPRTLLGGLLWEAQWEVTCKTPATASAAAGGGAQQQAAEPQGTLGLFLSAAAHQPLLPDADLATWPHVGVSAATCTCLKRSGIPHSRVLGQLLFRWSPRQNCWGVVDLLGVQFRTAADLEPFTSAEEGCMHFSIEFKLAP